jgi:hypothetical protein
VFGHIHAGYGTLRTPDILFVNAFLLGEDGGLSREPIVTDLKGSLGHAVSRPAEMERTLTMTMDGLIEKVLREEGVFPPSVLDCHYGDKVK